MSDFEGKVAIITGAAGGLGLTYARALVERGARVILADIQAEAVVAAAASIDPSGATARGVVLDVSDRQAWLDLVDEILRDWGRVDILVNNAAAGSTEKGRSLPWYQLPQEDFDRAMEVNVRGAFFGACAVAPHMIEKGAGKIVNVSSATVWNPTVRLSHYIASKAGVIGLTRALAVEFGSAGVTVNSLAPGLTRTDRMVQVYPAEVFESYAKARAIPRVEEPDDLVGPLLYLCSPASDFVTGQVLVVDGGIAFN